MRLPLIVPAALLMLTTLGACASLTLYDQRGDLVRSVQDFTQRLRWRDINAAAGYFEEVPEEDFREMFADSDDLQIVDVRVERVEMPQPGQASVEFIYQYYELPSITVRTHRVEQEWVLHPRGKGLSGEWKIASAFPPWR